mmetsp:Transcript_9267/g.20616  ORF Transcript_9267/g.20616 Transcript_9267/m.20616 type:complete len:488 (-) Transcript_9267:85-1548(-)
MSMEQMDEEQLLAAAPTRPQAPGFLPTVLPGKLQPRLLYGIGSVTCLTFFLCAAATWWRASQRDSKGPPDELYEFHSLGIGFCTDTRGVHAKGFEENGAAWKDAAVLGDGSSPECEQLCKGHPKCTGYATMASGKCGIIISGTFFPSWADRTPGAHCFWRHDFKFNSKDAYDGVPQPVPKILWTFWQNMPKEGEESVPDELPPFVGLCLHSWRRLNPDWQVNALNDTSIWNWMSRDDLPSNFDVQIVQHRADAIRLVLLERYGGVWLDATTLMLKPLSQIFGSGSLRPWFTLQTYWTVDAMHDRRINDSFYIENWFLAAPPQDPLIMATRRCASQLQQLEEPQWRPLAFTGLFSARQLGMLKSLQIIAYLSTHACFLKSIDEDAAFYHWWNSPAVHHIRASHGALRLNEMYGWDEAAAETIKQVLFNSTEEFVVANMTSERNYVMKVGGCIRRAVWGLSSWELYCKPGTFHEILRRTGLTDSAMCNI